MAPERVDFDALMKSCRFVPEEGYSTSFRVVENYDGRQVKEEEPSLDAENEEVKEVKVKEGKAPWITLELQAPVSPPRRRPNICVFDTETSSFKGSVVQLAYIITDLEGNVLQTYESLLKLPEDEAMDPRAEAVHNISRSKLDEEGKDPASEIDAFLKFYTDNLKSTVFVAHNAKFDIGRINFMAAKYNLEHRMCEENVFCTMKSSSIHCNLKKSNGYRKNPTNAELYTVLTGSPPDQRLHDALEDCKVTLRSYLLGKERDWW